MPEMHTLSACLPCGVDALTASLEKLRRALPNSSTHCFDVVTPVSPQPASEYVLFVGVTSWLRDHVVVFFDCHRVDARSFATKIPALLNRESILIAAGYDGRSMHNVFVHGLLQPLAPGQFITLYTGLLLTVAPRDQGAPGVFDLATRLQSRDGWSLDSFPPCPSWTPGSHFCILTDAWPVLVPVQDRRRFREDVVSALQAEDWRLVLKATSPRLGDMLFRGQPVSGLVVATERISGLRCPLRGFAWKLYATDHVPMQRLVEEFGHLCPPG